MEVILLQEWRTTRQDVQISNVLLLEGGPPDKTSRLISFDQRV